MGKNVFQPVEIVDLTAQKVKIEAPVFKTPEPEPLDLYEGPTADDLRLEADRFRSEWETEKARMIEEANEEVERIRQEAEKSLSLEEKARIDTAGRNQRIAEDEAARIVEEAQKEAEQIIAGAEAEREKVYAEAEAAAKDKGRDGGWEEGKAEAERLVGRLHIILNAAIEKRKKIISETESQVIDLVLLIARKVIKVISENQKNVVINNIVQALKKLKSRGNVSIRVNLEDLKLSTEHIKDFIQMVENVESITVLEDSSVDRGGALIETDFGEIDARIASQLKEIEDRVSELIPIRSPEDV